MKVSRAQAEENRRRIVATAGRLFRERGLDGIGVADLMKAAGLTHGGFYGHFQSKDDLASEAATEALAAGIAKWTGVIEGAENPVAALVALYLSEGHKREMGEGCALAALGPDAARRGSALKASFSEGVEAHLALLAEHLPGRTQTERRRKAMAFLAEMVGALVLARAVDDKHLARDLLGAATDDLKGRASGKR